jgi:hypothetical protein
MHIRSRLLPILGLKQCIRRIGNCASSGHWKFWMRRHSRLYVMWLVVAILQERRANVKFEHLHSHLLTKNCLFCPPDSRKGHGCSTSWSALTSNRDFVDQCHSTFMTTFVWKQGLQWCGIFWGSLLQLETNLLQFFRPLRNHQSTVSGSHR